MLTFKTEKPGSVQVRLYDTNGRLVRTFLDLSDAAAGYHDVRLDGRGDAGKSLASGVYFLRIQSVDRGETRTITILK
jgi:flagellar hook assembly protein FlgD